MSERKVRTSGERIAEIDKKIVYHKDCISKLEKKKKAILEPKKRERKITSMNGLVNKAKKSGMTLEEMAEKLGIKI